MGSWSKYTIAAVLGIIALVVLMVILIRRTQISCAEGEELEARIKCIGGHQYYYIWIGGTKGGPGIAPVLNFDGKAVECKNSIKIINETE
jgi:hypothetical protein